MDLLLELVCLVILFFQNLLYSIESGSVGLMMIDGIEVTTLNTPVQIVGLVLSARNGPKGTNT